MCVVSSGRWWWVVLGCGELWSVVVGSGEWWWCWWGLIVGCNAGDFGDGSGGGGGAVDSCSRTGRHSSNTSIIIDA